MLDEQANACWVGTYKRQKAHARLRMSLFSVPGGDGGESMFPFEHRYHEVPTRHQDGILRQELIGEFGRLPIGPLAIS